MLKILKENKYYEKIVSLVVTIMMLCCLGFNTFASDTSNILVNDTNNNYKYEVTPADHQWANFTNKDEMVNACKIPNDVLMKMSTEKLVNAVLDYPLIINIYAYNTYEEGLEALANESDAFKELLKRPDASEKLLNKLNQRIQLNSVASSDNEGSASLEKLNLKILLTEKTLWNSISDKTVVANILIGSSTTTVTTQNGTSVQVTIRGEEKSAADRTAIDNQFKSAYPNATFLYGSTTNYNCHSYAWYLANPSNTYWMDYPAAYMSDGSYTRISSPIYATAATRMYYDYGAHSAVVYAPGGPLVDARYLTVTSKWGEGPLMRHQAYYSPYTSNNVTLWDKK